MAYRTFVARAADGFPLVEAQGEAGLSPAAGVAQTARAQAQQLLTRLHSMTPYCSVDCAGGFVCHLRILDGVCYLGLFCSNYPRNAAFAFLEDVIAQFQEELKREFGTGSVDWRSHIDVIDKPYYFGRFDRQVARIYAQFRDPASSNVLSKLQGDLSQVSHIMKCNIDELMLRGATMDNLADKAGHLRHASREFESATKTLSKGFIQKYVVPILSVLAMAMLIYLLFHAEMLIPISMIIAPALVFFSVTWLSGNRQAKTAAKAANQLLAFAGEYGEHMHLI